MEKKEQAFSPNTIYVNFIEKEGEYGPYLVPLQHLVFYPGRARGTGKPYLKIMLKDAGFQRPNAQSTHQPYNGKKYKAPVQQELPEEPEVDNAPPDEEVPF